MEDLHVVPGVFCKQNIFMKTKYTQCEQHDEKFHNLTIFKPVKQALNRFSVCTEGVKN